MLLRCAVLEASFCAHARFAEPPIYACSRVLIECPNPNLKPNKKPGQTTRLLTWLGMRDSNPRSWDQNPLPYHLANPQRRSVTHADRGDYTKDVRFWLDCARSAFVSTFY